MVSIQIISNGLTNVEARTTVIMDRICAILTMEIADFAKTVYISGIFNDDSMRNENKTIYHNIF